MTANKLLNRTAVYRVIYYSGFKMTRTTSPLLDTYKLKSKLSEAQIYVEHTSTDNVDTVKMQSTSTFSEKELTRLARMILKIYRRTKNLKVEQDIVDVTKYIKNDEKPTEEVKDGQ